MSVNLKPISLIFIFQKELSGFIQRISSRPQVGPIDFESQIVRGHGGKEDWADFSKVKWNAMDIWHLAWILWLFCSEHGASDITEEDCRDFFKSPKENGETKNGDEKKADENGGDGDSDGDLVRKISSRAGIWKWKLGHFFFFTFKSQPSMKVAAQIISNLTLLQLDDL